jgi:hypothetical protein
MTPISLFYGPLRLLLDDWDPCVRRYPDNTLLAGVQTTVQLGRFSRAWNAPCGGFSLTPDGLSITPDVVTGNPQTVNLFAIGALWTAKMFLDPQRDRFSFRTRNEAQSMGNSYRYLATIEAEIHKLENGEMFAGYQNYWSWLSGTSGLPLGEILAQFDVQSPIWKATFTRDGMKVA